MAVAEIDGLRTEEECVSVEMASGEEGGEEAFLLCDGVLDGHSPLLFSLQLLPQLLLRLEELPAHGQKIEWKILHEKRNRE